MTALPNQTEVNRFRNLTSDLLGLQFDDSKLNHLAKVLHQRAQAKGEECEQYLSYLTGTSNTSDELSHLAGELTVSETFFLRNADQFKAFAEIALPERLAARCDGDAVRILSAGCASGEEPYSLAMVACETSAYALNRIAITALDVNPTVLDKAKQARYTNWSLRDFPSDMRARWFQSDGDGFLLDLAIRRMVKFEQRNLAQHAQEFWQPSSLDIVFCRNVLMYFSPEQAQTVIARIARALVPGGYFFLGHAETLRGLSNDFHLCHTHGTFYYQRKESCTANAPSGHSKPPRWQPTAPLGDTDWVNEIQRASDRIHALATPLAEAAAHSGHTAHTGVAPNLHGALEYLHKEQYDQTLAQLGALPPALALDPEALLLKAVSLCHSGALDAAQDTCRSLLACDELNAGAHYVLALCREAMADLAGAVEHDQTATYLDPGFAMPRLHLGLLARRQGDASGARRDLSQALVLLHKEEASRLLLFAGGFRREALIALCKAELTTLEANP